jgi:hypothetical protein
MSRRVGKWRAIGARFGADVWLMAGASRRGATRRRPSSQRSDDSAVGGRTAEALIASNVERRS